MLRRAHTSSHLLGRGSGPPFFGVLVLSSASWAGIQPSSEGTPFILPPSLTTLKGAVSHCGSTCVCVDLLYSHQLGGQRSPLLTTTRACMVI